VPVVFGGDGFEDVTQLVPEVFPLPLSAADGVTVLLDNAVSDIFGKGTML